MAEDRLGFIGLGTMGLPMSLNILDAGKALTVWGRNREKLQDALDAGATWAQSPKVMAEACDVIFLCVFDTAAVEEVVFGSRGIAEPRDGLPCDRRGRVGSPKSYIIYINSRSTAPWRRYW